ncbi:MAG: hypothetical protein ACHQVS_00375 [Candidatus Babeliales bacterium]
MNMVYNNLRHLLLALLVGNAISCAEIEGKQILQLSSSEAQIIGQKIWRNECRCSTEQLTWWKKGEEWASLGIGHFIWYPAHKQGPFTQTFPELLRFLAQHKIQLPAWLKKYPPCPWQTRESFFNDTQSPRMKELRALLSSTIELQAQFIANRLERTLPTMLATCNSLECAHIQKQFYRVANSPMGLYALIDYVNVKGEGTNPAERYDNQGWGLLQVLNRMQGTNSGKAAIQEFVTCAKTVLTERVNNAPPGRNEGQWLKGWHNRIDTYLAA